MPSSLCCHLYVIVFLCHHCCYTIIHHLFHLNHLHHLHCYINYYAYSFCYAYSFLFLCHHHHYFIFIVILSLLLQLPLLHHPHCHIIFTVIVSSSLQSSQSCIHHLLFTVTLYLYSIYHGYIPTVIPSHLPPSLFQSAPIAQSHITYIPPLYSVAISPALLNFLLSLCYSHVFHLNYLQPLASLCCIAVVMLQLYLQTHSFLHGPVASS